jgi:hypothetical protein
MTAVAEEEVIATMEGDFAPSPVLVHYDPGAGPVAMGEDGEAVAPVITRGVLTPEVVAMRQAEQQAGADWLIEHAIGRDPNVGMTAEERAQQAAEAAERRAEQERIEAQMEVERQAQMEADRLAHEEQARLDALRREAEAIQLRAEAVERFKEVRDYFGSYLILPDRYRSAYLTVLALWSLHTYSYKIAGVTPYIIVQAPTKNSGKTTVAEIASTVTHNPSAVEVAPTAPVVRTYASQGYTLFVDEIDQLASDKTFISVMNSGYRAGGSVTRMGKASGDDTVLKSSTFGPKMICGIAEEGDLPLPPPTLDRSIALRIFRARPGELGRRFRVDIMRDEPEVLAMRQWMERWTQLNHREIRDAYFDVPELSSTRAMEIWEPLITLAGLLGEEILADALAAARLIDGEKPADPEPNVGMVQDVAVIIREYLAVVPASVTDIRADDLAGLRDDLVGRRLVKKLPTEALVKRLGAFGIMPVVVKKDDADVLVYRLRRDGHMLPEWAELFGRYAS